MYRFNNIRSPEDLPGVKKKSFSMAFGGGEIWFEHLDGMYRYKELVLQKLAEDAKSFMRPSYPSLIAINVDETEIDKDIMSALTGALIDKNKKFTRVVIVGLERQKQKEFKKLLLNCHAGFALNFIDDFEKAKLWLVSESYI